LGQNVTQGFTGFLGSIHNSLDAWKGNNTEINQANQQANAQAWGKVAGDFHSANATSLISAVESATGENAALYGIGAVAALAVAVAISKSAKKEKVMHVELESFDMENPTKKESKKQIKATLKNIMMKNGTKANLM